MRQPALSFFIFLTQMAVIAQRMCWVSLLCNSNLLFRLPLCTKEENMYCLNSLLTDGLTLGWRGGLGHQSSRGPAASLLHTSLAWESRPSSLPPAFPLQGENPQDRHKFVPFHERSSSTLACKSQEFCAYQIANRKTRLRNGVGGWLGIGREGRNLKEA